MRRWFNSPDYDAVIKTLVDARSASGLSQRDVAARLQVPPSFIAKIELKERRVDVVEFVRIAQAIGTPVEQAFRQLMLNLGEPASTDL